MTLDQLDQLNFPPSLKVMIVSLQLSLFFILLAGFFASSEYGVSTIFIAFVFCICVIAVAETLKFQKKIAIKISAGLLLFYCITPLLPLGVAGLAGLVASRKHWLGWK